MRGPPVLTHVGLLGLRSTAAQSHHRQPCSDKRTPGLLRARELATSLSKVPRQQRGNPEFDERRVVFNTFGVDWAASETCLSLVSLEELSLAFHYGQSWRSDTQIDPIRKPILESLSQRTPHACGTKTPALFTVLLLGKTALAAIQ